MREFTKSSKLDNVLYDVRGPVVEEADRMISKGLEVLKLNIGNPAPFGFRAPEEVISDMSMNLRESEGYSNSKGIWAARKAIMQYAQNLHIPNLSMDDIYTGNGASELINLCMSALLDDGDEILIPAPDYPLWTACATLAGGKVVHYICDEQSEWYPDLLDMESKITDKTKAIVIINPNNPTGAVYPREVLEGIVKIAREHQLILFSDEIYDRLLMDGGLPHRLDGPQRQQIRRLRLHSGPQHARQHAPLLQRSRPVGRPDSARRDAVCQGVCQRDRTRDKAERLYL